MDSKHTFFFRRLLLRFPTSLYKGFIAGKRHSNGQTLQTLTLTLASTHTGERVSRGGASLPVNGCGGFLPSAHPLHHLHCQWLLPKSKPLFYHHRKALSSSSSSSSEQNCFPELDSPPPPSIQSSDQAKSGGSKRIKYSPAKQLTWNFDMCSKDGDVIRALDLFDSVSKESELALRERHYNVVLYLCSSAATGLIRRTKSGNMRSKLAANISPQVSVSEEEDDAVSVPKDVMELALRRGFEIWEHMQERNVSPNEATYTSLARLAMVKGDGDMAFAVVKKMAEARISPRLRSYGPALFTYCRNREPEKAFEVEAHMLAAGVEPEEEELRALLKASVEASLEDKVYSVLHKLRNAVRELSPTSVEIIEQWFKSDAASASIAKKNQGGFPFPEVVRTAVESNGGGWHGLGWLGHGKWKVERANIDKQGVCLCCGEQLCTIDIDPLETEKFSDSLFELACQRETSAQFKNFQSWLNKRPPFYAVVDAANVGLYNQNFTGGFRFQQLKAIVAELQAASPDNSLPLIILHNKRTRDLEVSLKSRKLIQEWSNAHSFFPTPTGSNDDWYWLYAAVKCKCLLVTNDEMRDHLFQILGNDFFPKWKERHQVKFTFENGKAVLHMPPPYSIVIQESASGAWHVPRAGGDDITTPRDWVCITRKTQNES